MPICRYENNPILKPKSTHSWEAQATFNGCPVANAEGIHLVYRALSLPHYSMVAKTKLAVSSIGIASSKDGINFHDRRRLIVPEENWERFGVEDPRVTKIDGNYYIFYTALSEFPFRASGIKLGVAITKDLKTIQERHLVTPFNAKGMALFPQKIDGKLWGVLTVNTDQPPAKICLVSFDNESDIWNENLWLEWYQNLDNRSLQLTRSSDDQVEVGAPPLRTKDGWLLIYSYIKNYFSPNPIFSIEAVLLDLADPHKIIAQTEGPLLVPQEYYERIGLVPNVVFPTGAVQDQGQIFLYYGAVDTVCCLAFINQPILLEKILKINRGKTSKFIRAQENPIISPIISNPWEAQATFNPAAITINNLTYIVYRAMSFDNTSVFGLATSSDGIKIDYRSPQPIYVPRESFEQKSIPGGNSGCEDPRLTQIGDKIYMLYTAFDGKNPPRVAITWIAVVDFVNHSWNWSLPVLITPPEIDDKDACIFPEKFNDQYFIIHRSGDDIDSAFSPTLNFDGKTWIDEYRWIGPRPGMWDDKKVGIASPPIKTAKGWILLYHGVSEKGGIYRLGACLLDLYDPTKIISRLDKPIFEPEAEYELKGIVPNVVFPCGAVVISDKIFIYYGGGDRVTGVASIKVADLLSNLEFWK